MTSGSRPAPAIEACGLGRDYGATRALEALDLRIPAGSLTGLVGPNGAGKTTALLLMATLLRPSRGTVSLHGLDVHGARAEVRRLLGVVFQEPSVDGLLSVRENLAFAAALAGLGGREARTAVDSVIDRTGLGGRARQPARELSGGWRRLTDIARATLHRPALLLLDEPTVGLDPEHRERMWSLLDAERRDRGVTILFSTHYMQEAESSERVILLAGGRVVGDGTPDRLRAEVGDQVAEFEGPGAEGFATALADGGGMLSTVRTGRSWRVGLQGASDRTAALVAQAPGITRFTLRPATLEDVYFVRTGAARTEAEAG